MKTKLNKSALDAIAEFDTEDLFDTWEEFMIFRDATAKTRIKTPESEIRIFGRLVAMSKNIQKLKAIVEQTIDNGWMGFFEPRDWKDETTVDNIDFEKVTRKEMDSMPNEVHMKMKRGWLRRYIQLYPEKF